jgi:hypothetical protein
MDIRRSTLFAACILFGTAVTPAMSFDEFKAAHACRALVVDPSSAVNLGRPFALRYRSAPLRLCVPDDTNMLRPIAFA